MMLVAVVHHIDAFWYCKQWPIVPTRRSMTKKTPKQNIFTYLMNENVLILKKINTILTKCTKHETVGRTQQAAWQSAPPKLCPRTAPHA